MIKMDGKVAIVTGAARGLGEAIAQQLCELGAAVVLTDILTDAGKNTCERLQREGYQACFISHDVTSEAGWGAVVKTALDTFGRVDYLVNNAGINIPKHIEDATPAEFQSILNVNLMGPFIGTKAVIAAMKAAGGGAIVNVSSNSSRKVVSLTSMYSASKAALANLTKTTAVHLAQTGTNIRANSVHPGAHETHMVLGESTQAADVAVALKGLTDAIPMKRMGKPPEVAKVVAFLLSDAASYMTGEEVVIDGGSSVV